MHLADWMERQGLTDARVAEMAKVNRATISRVRRGINRPSWELIASLKEISGGKVTPEDFLGAAQ